ncbi:hypothetical protein GCM10007047_06560 [Cerasicoccus arenae]|uniref:UVR domain-containing protein n=1 Tax=Cerasicoccus arenae TaxID=424488 RepID=A0A8J3GDS1_9BACT|nr:hypothetical protein GCM10007047_06560 [Cerasicoccus arenae]
MICGEVAKVYVNLVKTGHMAHSAYCLAHAEELGILSPGAYALLDAENGAEADSHSSLMRCASCGFSLRDWKRTGRFGCADCYDTFSEKIEPALKRLHLDTVHRGKIPKGAYSSVIVENRIRDLQRQLENAVQEERFEDAAAARDLMSELKSWQPSD